MKVLHAQMRLMPKSFWRLLFRHVLGVKSRSALRWMNFFAFVGLSLGFCAWLIVSSVMGGLQGDIKERILAEKPHLLWEGTPKAGVQIPRVGENSVIGVQALLQTEALLEKNDNGVYRSVGVLLQGVSPAEVTAQGQAISGNQVIVGAELANRMNLFAGEIVQLRSAWALDKEALEVVVKESFESGLYDIDRMTLKISQETLSQWLGLENRISRLEIQIKDPLQVDSVVMALEKSIGLDLKTWKETEASLWYSLRLEKILMSIAVFFVILLASFALYMALAVRVTEKSREMGLLRALGTQESLLLRLYMLEGLFIGVLALVVGLGFAWLVCDILSRGFIRLPDIYYATEIPVDWSWLRALWMFLAALVVVLWASYWPAKKGTQFSMSEALRS